MANVQDFLVHWEQRCRDIAYVDELLYTLLNKVAKHEIIAGVDDLRMDAWD